MRRRLIEVYYLATPLFVFVDLALHAPVRVALGGFTARAGYYVALVVLGLFCRARPRWAPVVGMAESSFNLLLLFLSVLLPIWSATDQVTADGPIDPGLGLAPLVNVALAGTMAIVSFKRSERALFSRWRRSA